ncbi:hypothetical protein QR680_006447 [Steinernema hermaphroditum]|uniref:Papilin n=1 Tax=Steinernema hermaphroditum TaxID=289476 RepID=A0AA39HVK0_9BILA|nr:hypothetical protein QR680_006447 [Steinernema hermaphroditum]
MMPTRVECHRRRLTTPFVLESEYGDDPRGLGVLSVGRSPFAAPKTMLRTSRREDYWHRASPRRRCRSHSAPPPPPLRPFVLADPIGSSDWPITVRFGVTNIMRLLWCIAALCATALAFKLPYSDEVRLHPLSPAEVDPSSARVKRQAYQVHVAGDVSVTVDKGGQAETGAWGPWTPEQECSRTCGGGVQVEKRQCSGDCTGASTRYVSCNIDACPEGSVDFRAEQCSQHNDSPLDGNYYKWIPYPGKNKCELTCKPDSERFYYKWAEKVVDGTKCDGISNDICVDGVCLPLGCDGKLGSSEKNDKCGVCGGDGSTCKTVEGFFDERNLSPGYHDIIMLPEGATSIKIEEMRPTTNSLAIKNGTDHFYLNGNYQIQVIDKPLPIAGTTFEYDSRKSGPHSYEKLVAKGPLTEDLTIALLFQRGNKHSAIRYEFSVPLEQDTPYIYKPGEWSECSVTCGQGVHTRTPYCIDTKTQARVEDDNCEAANVTKPETEKTCQTVDCEAEWFTGEWEQCSQSCGNEGTQYRTVYCHRVFKDGSRKTVSDDDCKEVAERPPVQQSCNRHACPEWQAGPWSACSEKCGDALQYRSVTCRSEKEGQEGKLLAADQCNADEKPNGKRGCNLGPCEGLKFVLGEWNLCQKCNDTEETREVTCKDTQGRAYPIEKCLNDKETEIPIDTRPCATVQPCIYEWHTSQWSKCSTECGHGHKTRRVTCAIHEMGDISIVDEGLCQGDKPENRMNCTNEEKCTGTYFTSEWGKCSAECGGGKQSRLIVCLNYDKVPVPEWCDEAEKPADEQECNVDACPTCEDGEFGCCPDNTTFATGLYFEGCSNCSISEFGCCADNVTEATGPNAQGCEEFVPLADEDVAEASGEEVEAIVRKAEGEDEQCQVTNEEGEVATVSCGTNATEVEDLLEGEGANVTIHCSKTKFGCCPDWYTAAEGENHAGCPQFVLGNCNETEHGCCPDEVTLARGPNLEGCGEPSCAASLYGCCKDRKTIAFGPHYAGCERSSFPCELSAYGCCPDGETAALGFNGTGCGADCLVTKFGCCPDGKTVAKGLHNEGCGCEFAQFGCCPDGKSPAKGVGFYGCPESCAQSQFGCCPDGKTAARGSNKEGCPCQYTRYGCCPDGETTALGPKNDGCDDCRYAKYGCCPDGETKSLGPDYAGCPSTTVAPFMVGGTVSPQKILACGLPQDQGTVCHPGYKLVWFYDTAEGRCSQFWFGGCDGNENRFATKEQCETICVDPPEQGRCYLQKVEGPQRCNQLAPRYWYDYTTGQCAAFWWRGCLGNSNNFVSWEECNNVCAGVGPPEQTTPAAIQQQPQLPIQVPTEAPQPYIPEQPIPQQHPDQQPQETHPDQARIIAEHERIRAEEQRRREEHFRREQERREQEARQRPGPGAAVAPAQSRDACNQRVDKGRCDGHFASWYYEVATGTCEQFQYTGCGGNQNRFPTKDQCESLCLRAAASPRIGQGVIPEIQAQAPKSSHVCDEAKDTGPCSQFTTKWFYNKADGTCNRFHYGGCEGTGNRFDSEQECKGTCGEHVDTCTLPKVKGPCGGKNQRFFFNKDSQQCEEFVYSGCLGNSNNFDSKEECDKRCPVAPITNHVEEELDKCELPVAPGPCRAYFRRFYFDQKSKRCEQFVYGGCQGNANRFESLEECENSCGAHRSQALTFPEEKKESVEQEQHSESDNSEVAERDVPADGQEEDTAVSQVVNVLPDSVSQAEFDIQPITQSAIQTTMIVYPQPTSELPELCRLPEEQGACFDEILRWRYSLEDGECIGFLYTGCGANANHFTSEEECQRACGPFRDLNVCKMPKAAGDCKRPVTKWHYNPESKTCSNFMWSGCGGNGNRFSSKAECEHLCALEEKVENANNVCELERDSGPCTDAVSQWYFSKQDGECRKFTFGGCRGNGNRFDTKEQCEKKCVVKSQNLVMFEPKKVCTQPFEKGPCSASEEQFYFDFNSGRCRSFTYGGCEGNSNRFDSKDICYQLCGKIAQKSSIVTQVKSGNNTFHVGDTVEIECVGEFDEDEEITWLKNGEPLPLRNRFNMFNNNRSLEILFAKVSDSGTYLCSTGEKDATFEPLKIEVSRVVESNKVCVDKGMAATCRMVVQRKMCNKPRFAKHCCESCKRAAKRF